MVGGRRRTDVPDGLWRGVPDAALSDHPTAPGRDRGRLEAAPSRRPTAAAVANRPAGTDAPVSRPRLPLPPVPASPRAAAGTRRAADAASTGPTGLRSGAPAPRLPRQSGASDARYGDWTKPARAGDLPSEEEVRPVPAPATTAIPERSVTRRDEDAAHAVDAVVVDDAEPTDDIPAPRAERPSRAASRAERQAADVARRKAAKAGGVALLDEEPRRAPRRMAKGLVAMGVVALGVLGVYQFTSPETDEAGAATQTVPTPAPVAPIAPLPELTIEPAPAEPVVTTPVRVPLTVLNATSINGLAGKVSDTVVAGGWESAGVGAYEGDDVAASTVFFTEGDETQRQAAVQLVDQFPQLQGPAPRFFELPADVTTPGLVIVVTGDWTP